MKIGVQLYGLSHALGKTRNRLYQEAAGIGFSSVEPCVVFSEDFPAEDSGLMRPEEVLADLPAIHGYGLDVPSIHVYSTDFYKDMPAMRNFAKQSGIRQYVLKLPGRAIPDCREFARKLSWLADRLGDTGVGLLLHNEPQDTVEISDGINAYAYLLEQLPGKVQAQVDVGNLLAGGQDPESFLWKYKDRIRSIHFKDRLLSGRNGREMPLGKGSVDVAACYQFARAMGIPKIIDMDHGSLEDYRTSVALMAGLGQCRDNTSSLLWSMDTVSGEKKLLHRFEKIIEAPNWTKDGKSILFNSNGHIYLYSLKNDRTSLINTGECTNCNNDHVLSPDGRFLGISHARKNYDSNIYIVELANGRTHQVTGRPYSFLHGWSQDGRTLSYCGIRMMGDKPTADIYTIPTEGGKEERLTDGKGYNDGPEFAPDGSIWFNSTISGLMQIYRMDAQGTNKQQMTRTDANTWFPHISPDNRKVVYLSFRKDDLEPQEHLPNMFVSIHIMNSDGSNTRKLADFFGGQGSINVNSWAPDSRHIALVTYELHHG